MADVPRPQVTDTPGVLDRKDEDRNAMERLTLACLQHLPSVVVFVVDFTEECGSSLQAQWNIRQTLKSRFFDKPAIHCSCAHKQVSRAVIHQGAFACTRLSSPPRAGHATFALRRRPRSQSPLRQGDVISTVPLPTLAKVRRALPVAGQSAAPAVESGQCCGQNRPSSLSPPGIAQTEAAASPPR